MAEIFRKRERRQLLRDLHTERIKMIHERLQRDYPEHDLSEHWVYKQEMVKLDYEENSNQKEVEVSYK